MQPIVLDDYFAEGPYRFQMRFGRGSFAEFYAPTAEHDEILAERRSALESAEERYFRLLPEAAPLIEETLSLAVDQQTVNRPPPDVKDSRDQALFLGRNWEPDYLLLAREGDDIRLVCGCVCFPSSWALEDKIGLRIADIHEIVPALNAVIGRQIETFLRKLKPGASWTRNNWGLSRWPDRNQHPRRKLPRLDAGVNRNEVFFRLEEQSLVALPQSGGLLFGIRIKAFPLSDFLGTSAGEKLSAALRTMPLAMADYKGLSAARQRILQLLKAS
jgi:hypothetical protein